MSRLFRRCLAQPPRDFLASLLEPILDLVFPFKRPSNPRDQFPNVPIFHSYDITISHHQYSTIPLFHHSIISVSQHSNLPLFQSSSIPTFQSPIIPVFEHSTISYFIYGYAALCPLWSVNRGSGKILGKREKLLPLFPINKKPMDGNVLKDRKVIEQTEHGTLIAEISLGFFMQDLKDNPKIIVSLLV
jgi:hypothetical protein